MTDITQLDSPLPTPTPTPSPEPIVATPAKKLTPEFDRRVKDKREGKEAAKANTQKMQKARKLKYGN